MRSVPACEASAARPPLLGAPGTRAESFGTPMSAVLRTQSADLRLRRRQRAEEEAQKAPVKMTIPLMLVIMPATILLLLGPALASLATVFG